MRKGILRKRILEGQFRKGIAEGHFRKGIAEGHFRKGMKGTVHKLEFIRNMIPNPKENGTLAIPKNFSGDFEELEETVQSMMEKSQNSLPYRE